MKALLSVGICLISAIGLNAQAVGHPSQNLKDQANISVINPKLPPLPVARWDTAKFQPFPNYPGMAKIAGVEGELMMHAQVDSKGIPVSTKLVFGPGPLASTLDKWIRGVRFFPLPEDGPGPWHFSFSAKCTLSGGFQIFPTARKLSSAE